jgi:hypothetical protein
VKPALTLPLLALLAAMLPACDSPPRGESSGRVGLNTTTRAETSSTAILPTSLVEASDKITQALAADIARIAEEEGKGYRVTIIVGNIENKTQGQVATQDFEFVRDRIRSNLLSSKMVRDNVAFRAERAGVEEVNRRELGPAAAANNGAIDAPNVQYTLQLSGTMYGILRGSTNQYYIEFKLIRASDGLIVFSNNYEVKRG